MKKILTTILFAFLIILAGAVYLIYAFNQNKMNSIRDKISYQKYIEKEITGTEMITLINKVIDHNERNSIQKDEKGKYIEDDESSIQIEIKFLENDASIPMEAISKNGTNQFLKYYDKCKFKCKEIEYHNKTKKVKKFTFEQI